MNYITNEIYSEFNGIFLCDVNTIYKFYIESDYGTFTRNNKATVFEPIGRKYPVVVSNALINYTTGSLSGTIISDDSLFAQFIDRIKEKEYRDALLDFLVNKKAKILKDLTTEMAFRSQVQKCA